MGQMRHVSHISHMGHIGQMGSASISNGPHIDHNRNHIEEFYVKTLCPMCLCGEKIQTGPPPSNALIFQSQDLTYMTHMTYLTLRPACHHLFRRPYSTFRQITSHEAKDHSLHLAHHNSNILF